MFHYDQAGQLIGEQNGTTTTDYIYLGTIPVAIGKSSTPQIYYINADQLNTPRVITDETGNTVWQWDGEAFGNTPPNENPGGAGNFTFNLRFPGQYFDVETNLNQNYFRDYDPATGRYIQSDPIGLKGGINTFLYVEANPMSYVDPLGLWGLAGTIDFSYYIMGGAGTGFGVFLSPDADKCLGGGYAYTSTGGGMNVGATASIGFFVGNGTESFVGDGKFNNLSLGPLSFTFGYSEGHFSSFQIGLTAGTPDILLAGASAGKASTPFISQSQHGV